MIMPPPLQRGDSIGIIAPASAVDPSITQQAVALITQQGYIPVLGKAIYDQYGYLAGSDDARLDDVTQMFADPQIKAIFCLRGGYGSLRIVSRLDYRLIRRNPKWLIGYSDITTLLLAIYQQTGMLSIHGPMLAELPESNSTPWWQELWTMLEDPTRCITYPATKTAHYLFPGKAMGPVVGGNLSLLTASLGTPFEIDTAGKILFIEEVGEPPYRIDRMLTQLRLAGKLQLANGIIFGDFTKCDPPRGKPSISLLEILAETTQLVDKPAYMGLPAGHSLPNFPLVIGAPTIIDATACCCTIFPTIN